MASPTAATLSPDLQSLVFASAVRWNGTAAYNAVRALYETAADTGLRNRALGALSAARDPVLLQATLDYALSTAVRSQDTVSVVVGVAANPLGRALAWNFFKENFDTFNNRYGAGGSMVQSLVAGITNLFSSETQFDDVRSFFEAHPFPATQSAIEKSLESIKAQSLFRQNQLTAMCGWLAAQSA